MSKIDKLTQFDLAYIAGFIDADGCINCQIVRRHDYRLKFQIRLTLTIFQKTTRHWVVLWFKKKIGIGTVRKRTDGISEFVLVGKSIKNLLIPLLPFLKVKRKQALLVVHIINHLSKNQDPQSFLKLCEQVDQVAFLNDSKKRTITASVVRDAFLKDYSSFPVETETKEPRFQRSR